jgi:nucleotide-binding universal stress UspA family protein
MAESRHPIVICYDDSEPSRHAIAEAARLFPGARAIVLHVWRSIESTFAYRYSAAGVTGALREAMDELETAGAKMAQTIADQGAQLARDAGLDAEARAVEADEPVAETVTELVESEDASVVVLGSRGLGALHAVVLGGFSGGVVRRSRRPLLVVPAPHTA